MADIRAENRLRSTSYYDIAFTRDVTGEVDFLSGSFTINGPAYLRSDDEILRHFELIGGALKPSGVYVVQLS